MKCLHEQSVATFHDLIVCSRTKSDAYNFDGLKSDFKRLQYDERESLKPLKQSILKTPFVSKDTSVVLAEAEKLNAFKERDLKSFCENEFEKFVRGINKIKDKRYEQYGNKIQLVKRQFNTDDLITMRKMMCDI